MTGGGHDGCLAWIALVRVFHWEKKLLSWGNKLLVVAARSTKKIEIFRVIVCLRKGA